MPNFDLAKWQDEHEREWTHEKETPEVTQIPLPLSSKATSQREKIRQLLQDGIPHSTPEIVQKCYGPGLQLARVAARIHELRRSGLDIESDRDSVNPGICWYCLVGKKEHS